jgi:hypothetical protein
MLDWNFGDFLGFLVFAVVIAALIELFTGGISDLFKGSPFDLTPVECDSRDQVEDVRDRNAHVFTSWNALRGFIAMHYPDMDENDIEEYEEQWREDVLRCAPGKRICFVVTECGVKPVLPEAA